jgi:RNA polymerase sigma-70 factor (ECF subfamily)
MSASDDSCHAGQARFATTRWSVVVAARDADGGESRQALATLCETYWYPLYAFIRRRGYSPHEAEDLTQEFFARLVEKDFLADVERARGKFRSYLLASCSHFLANQNDRDGAWKRGGRASIASLDFHGAEDRYRREPAHSATPEKLFERRWGLTLLDHALNRLRQDYIARNKKALFDELRVGLLGTPERIPYARVAQNLGMSPAALRVAVHRLRQAFHQALRDEIAKTVDDPGQIEDEIRDLFAAVAREKRHSL